jgi:hypothetical protein
MQIKNENDYNPILYIAMGMEDKEFDHYLSLIWKF